MALLAQPAPGPGWEEGTETRGDRGKPCFVSFPQCCEAIYSSVSGLKAHLANCNKVGPSFYSLGPEVGLGFGFLSPQDCWEATG